MPHREQRRLAIPTVLFRMRWLVLALLVLGTGAGGFLAFRATVPPPDVLIMAAASFVLAAGVAFVHLRHTGMAIVTALAPAMGMVAAGLAARGLAAPDLVAIYGAGCVVAALTSGEIVRGALAEGVKDAAMFAFARLAVPVLLSALAGAALLAVFRDHPALPLHAAGLLIASVASGLLATAFAGAVLPFGEGFFTSANRARERREQWLRVPTAIVEPRWGLSVSGIALVLGVLGWFGAEPFLGHLFIKPAIWAASGLGVFLLAFAAGRDWREALAVLLASAMLVLLDLWLWGTAVRHLPPVVFVTGLAMAYPIMLVQIAMRRRFFISGDDSAVARLRALEDLGAAPYFAMATAVAAMLPWIVPHHAVALLSATVLLAGGGAILVQPAIATALEWFVPHRRSLKQLYGRG